MARESPQTTKANTLEVGGMLLSSLLTGQGVLDNALYSTQRCLIVATFQDTDYLGI